jgi:dimethylargininase
MSRRSGFVRRGYSRLPDGIVTHIERIPVDALLAGAQLTRWVGVLTSRAWDVLALAAGDQRLNSVSVEDAMVIHGDLSLIARPGDSARRPEIAGPSRRPRGQRHDRADLGACDARGRRCPPRRENVNVSSASASASASDEPGRGAARRCVPLRCPARPRPDRGRRPPEDRRGEASDGSIVGYPPLVVDPESFPALRPRHPGATRVGGRDLSRGAGRRGCRRARRCACGAPPRAARHAGSGVPHDGADAARPPGSAQRRNDPKPWSGI